jgi:hypothetical protein
MGEKMKKLHFASLLFVAMSITGLQTEWIDSNSASCTSNGGKLSLDDFCEANWYQAKNICSSMDARLLAIDELTEVVTDCGGVVDVYQMNRKKLSISYAMKLKGLLPISFFGVLLPMRVTRAMR